MATVFTPSHKSLFSLFEPGIVYTIPSYQRPYSWQAIGKSDRNNQVNQMWEDLWEFFEDKKLSQKEYFLGSMVLIERQRNEFDVVDGQQRLTTITLLFAAMRCFLKKFGETEETREFVQDSIATLEKHLYNKEGIGLKKQLKVKIGQETGYSYQGALGNAIECKDPDFSARMSEEERVVASRYTQNRDYFEARLKEKFLSDDKFTIDRASAFDEFYKFISHRVSLVLIMTTDFETAYSIFEILNNRGLPLTSRDLLKNFLIKELAAAGHENAPEAWTALERDGDLTEDFIGRWVESNGRKQQYSAFNDAKGIYEKNFQDKPGHPAAFQFLEVLRADLERYNRIIDADQRLTDTVMRNKIKAIRVLGNERYSLALILALFRARNYANGSDTETLAFLSVYQRWVWYTILTPGVRFSSGPVFRAIQKLNEGNPHSALAAFQLNKEQLSSLRTAIQGRMDDHEVARWLLATYLWWFEGRSPDVVRQTLDLNKATLEHICPQQPEHDSNWKIDFSDGFREDYGRRLGNMTLLTFKMNAGAKNSDFSRKRDRYYKETQLPLTVELSKIERLSEAFIRERHERIVAGIVEDLNLQ